MRKQLSKLLFFVTLSIALIKATGTATTKETKHEKKLVELVENFKNAFDTIKNRKVPIRNQSEFIFCYIFSNIDEYPVTQEKQDLKKGFEGYLKDRVYITTLKAMSICYEKTTSLFLEFEEIDDERKKEIKKVKDELLNYTEIKIKQFFKILRSNENLLLSNFYEAKMDLLKSRLESKEESNVFKLRKAIAKCKSSMKYFEEESTKALKESKEFEKRNKKFEENYIKKLELSSKPNFNDFEELVKVYKYYFNKVMYVLKGTKKSFDLINVRKCIFYISISEAAARAKGMLSLYKCFSSEKCKAENISILRKFILKIDNDRPDFCAKNYSNDEGIKFYEQEINLLITLKELIKFCFEKKKDVIFNTEGGIEKIINDEIFINLNDHEILKGLYEELNKKKDIISFISEDEFNTLINKLLLLNKNIDFIN